MHVPDSLVAVELCLCGIDEAIQGQHPSSIAACNIVRYVRLDKGEIGPPERCDCAPKRLHSVTLHPCQESSRQPCLQQMKNWEQAEPGYVPPV